MSKVNVIGAGAWGTTLAILLAENGQAVTLWVYEKELVKDFRARRENKQFLPGFPLSESIEFSSDLRSLPVADFYFLVVPTQFLRSVAGQLSVLISKVAVVVCASKGLEDGSLKLPLDILKEELPSRKFAVLSGPNLSREIAQGQPAATVVAAAEASIAKAVQEVLMLERFRVYTSADPLGVQLGGALKNVIAIAAGIADGLELGTNAKSALMIRGIAEITRLGVALGAKPETFTGLSGMGDLIATCFSELSRNHTVGEQLAQGKKLAEILAGMKDVAEGVPTAKVAVALGKKYKVELPITQEVYQVLYQGKKPFQAISDLMTRTAKGE